MDEQMRLVATQFTAQPPAFQPSDIRLRRLSQLAGLFSEGNAYQERLAKEDPVVYEMHVVGIPEQKGHLMHSVTVMHPGKIGSEYFMTAGHYHEDPQASEVYYCLAGEGYLLIQTRAGDFDCVAMKPGTAAYIPPGWSHRTANTGTTPFVFLAVWPADAGHNYGAIKQTGFARLVIEQHGVPYLITNPNYHPE